MTDPVQLAWIAAAVVVVPSILSVITNWRVGNVSLRLAKMQQAQRDHHIEAVTAIAEVKQDIKFVDDKVREVDGNVNGKMAKLLEISEAKAKAEGKLEAKQEATDEAAVKALDQANKLPL